MPSSKDLKKIFQGAYFNFDLELPDWCFCTDTRQIEKNSWFVALKGKNFNGHDFIQNALEAGAKGLIVSEKPPENINIPYLLVPDTLKAYQQIAHYHRITLKPVVIAITGSNGKTTTKEILYSVLSEKYETIATYQNENNEIGVPKTILRADSGTQFLIIECGMRGLGQIEELTLIAEPDSALITNIGVAHIGLLGSKENIAQAKAEIFINLKDYKEALLPIKEPLLETWKNKCQNKINFREFGNFHSARFKPPNTHFKYKNNKFYLQTSNLALIKSVCAIIDLAFDFDFKPEEIQNGLNKFLPTAGRGALHQLKTGAYLIDETYNANPDSVSALASSINQLAKNKKKILILGEMAELGDLAEDLLNQLAHKIYALLDYFILIGESNHKLFTALKDKAILFNSIEEAYQFLSAGQAKYLNANCVLGLKASRSARLEELLHKLQE